uniref:Uncharacterized protein n=1 Tax=Anguilla anguilla TaxID=7936 RepID=A0A0E9QP20_ANGAN
MKQFVKIVHTVGM